MTLTAYLLFWASVTLITYTYLLYPLLLVAARILRPKLQPRNASWVPSVSLVIAVYNEESIIWSKIKNLEKIDYLREKIEFLFGSDGSTDRTNEILTSISSPAIHIRVFPRRRGKAAVLNDLIPQATGEAIVLSDANTLYDPNTIKKLVSHFADKRIGAVCGRLVLTPKRDLAGNVSEVAYWTYENFIKQLESDLSTTVGATGAVYAIRKTLFAPLPEQKTVMDDFLIPMEIIRKGYKVKYEPEALAYETVSDNISDEYRRRVRIGAANFHGISEYASLLHPRYGFVSFALWSHKILRWCVPFLIVALTLSAIMLAGVSEVYKFFLATETVFLVLALAGFICEKVKLKIGFLNLPYYFVAINTALFVGFVKFLLGKQRATWDVIR